MKCDYERLDLQWYLVLNALSSSTPAVSPKGMIYLPGGGYGLFSCLHGNSALASAPWPKFRGNPRNTGNAADNP